MQIAMLQMGLLPIFAFATGAVVGSFVTLVADRWPRGERWVGGRSLCRSCERPLGALQLVPLISFMAQRGRCTWCRAHLPADLWLGELAGGLVGLIALAHGGDLPGTLALAGFGATLVLLALLDARHMWLPDALTLPLAAAGLAAVLVLPAPDIWQRGLGLMLGWATLEGLRASYRWLRHREGLGGGDPKLLAAIGAWLGAGALPMVVLIAALLGLGWAGLLALRGRPVGGAVPIPLGTALAVAALAWLATGAQLI